MKLLGIAGLLIIGLSSLLIAPVQSQTIDSLALSQNMKRPRFQIQINGIYATLETNLRFESSSGILGVKINFEDNLGMDKYRVMPMFNARFNVKKRHNIFALYYGLPRDAYYVTKRDIDFGDRFIAEGTEVFSYFNTNVYSLGLRF